MHLSLWSQCKVISSLLPNDVLCTTSTAVIHIKAFILSPLDSPGLSHSPLPAFPSLNTCFLLIHFPPGSQRDLFKIINQIVLLLDFKTFSDSALGVKAKLLTWPPNPEAVWSLPSPAAHRPPLSLFTILQLLWHSCRLMNGPSSFLSLLRSLFHLFLTRVITPTGKPSLTTPAIYIWPLLRLPYCSFIQLGLCDYLCSVFLLLHCKLHGGRDLVCLVDYQISTTRHSARFIILI